MNAAPPVAPAGETYVSADDVWLGGWRGPSVLRSTGNILEWVGPLSGSTEAPTAHIPGTVFGGFTDSHVHLGLVDPAGLVAGGIARVLDLGNNLDEVRALWGLGETEATAVTVDYAGALITAPGGYPSDRSWAPSSWIREVATPEESAAAVSEMVAAAASAIKITLNAVGAPVFSERMLRTVVTQAHNAGLPVVAHPEGAGQAMRAAAAGVDILAHTPWTERLSDDEISALASSVSIISTLDIHGYGQATEAFAIASDNLSRFAAVGGVVRYGTDLGNGPLPIGINARELAALSAAGLDAGAIAAALVPHPSSASFVERISWIPGVAPADPDAVASWFSTASVLAISALKETFA